jgi:hypothetical protein
MVARKVLRSKINLSTQNFDLGIKLFSKINKEIFVTVSEWKIATCNVVTFCSELRLRHEYNRWKALSKRKAS